MIKGGIEHANDFRAFVADNGGELLVPQHRDRKSDHNLAGSDKRKRNRHDFHHNLDQRRSKDP